MNNQQKPLRTKEMTFEQLICAMRTPIRPKGDIALSWCKKILYFYDKGELVYKEKKDE